MNSDWGSTAVSTSYGIATSDPSRSRSVTGAVLASPSLRSVIENCMTLTFELSLVSFSPETYTVSE